MNKKLTAIITSTIFLASAGSFKSRAITPNDYFGNITQTNTGQDEGYITLRGRKITKQDDNDNDKLDFKLQTLNNQEYEIIGRSEVKEVLNPIRERINKAFEEDNYQMILVHGKADIAKRVLELSEEGVTIIYNSGEIYIGQIL